MLTGQMLRDKCAPRNPHPRIRKRISDIKTLDRISETAPEPKIEESATCHTGVSDTESAGCGFNTAMLMVWSSEVLWPDR